MPKISINSCPSKFNSDWNLKYLFTLNHDNNAQCVVCGKEFKLLKKSNISRHYNKQHKDKYANYSDEEKLKLIENNRTTLNPSLSSPDCISSESAAKKGARHCLLASYRVALEIAKNKKSFAEGEFIKSCSKVLAESFGDLKMAQKFEAVPLSRKTIARRITTLGEQVERSLKILLESCPYFSLCLDESNDVTDVSQLQICIRMVDNNFVAYEEMLAMYPMYGTTKGEDIFNAVKLEVNKFGSFEKCSCITTDGAPAMTGKGKGFVGMLRQNNIMCPTLHCIIHQDALCGKCIKLSVAMNTVTKITNLIRGGHHSLSHRQLKEFLHDVNAAHPDLLMHCPIRWLSAGHCLVRFFALRGEILIFLQTEVQRDTTAFEIQLTSPTFLGELAFLTDIVTHMNESNLQLQGRGHNIAHLCMEVSGFLKRLQLFRTLILKNILTHFPCCKEIKDEYPEVDFSVFGASLEQLISEFELRFQDFKEIKNDILLFVNPIKVDISEQKSELQLELCDLQTDLFLPTITEKPEEFFKSLSKTKYPKLRDFGLRMFSMFGTTYMCESNFSIMKIIKNKQRNRLNDNSLQHTMRLATTSIPIDIVKIVNAEENPRTSH